MMIGINFHLLNGNDWHLKRRFGFLKQSKCAKEDVGGDGITIGKLVYLKKYYVRGQVNYFLEDSS